nr:hypothetical protein [Kibdelosporangium sp. MJ126-NF4]CTQ98997.1 hypothetical protein [Kibdelosporangium sp. MJ126-NF4]
MANLGVLHGRMRPCFARSEPFGQANRCGWRRWMRLAPVPPARA